MLRPAKWRCEKKDEKARKSDVKKVNSPKEKTTYRYGSHNHGALELLK